MISYPEGGSSYRVARAGMKEGVDVFEGLRAEIGAKAKMIEDLTRRTFEVTVLGSKPSAEGGSVLTLLATTQANARIYTLDVRRRTLYSEEPSGLSGGAYRSLHIAYDCR